MHAAFNNIEENEIDEFVDEHVYPTDAARGYEADIDSDWYSRHYLLSFRTDKPLCTDAVVCLVVHADAYKKNKGIANAGFYYPRNHDPVMCY